MIDLDAITARYKPHLESHGIYVSSNQPYEDTLLIKWWMSLQETGDIIRLIVPDSRKLKKFLDIFTFPTTFFYSLNQRGDINCANWFTPVDQSSQNHNAYSGFWLSQNARATRHALNFVALTYSLAFEFYFAIIGTTWQKELLDEHTKLGYNIVGCIPNLHDQPFCYIVHLTREAFFASRLYQTYRKQYERS